MIHLQIESRKASALLLACRYRRTDLVKWLLSKKSSVDLTDEAGLGVMHCAIGECEILDDAQAQEIVNILRLLVQGRASTRAREDSKDHKQPLHYCAITGNYYAAHFLLGVDRGAVNLIDTQKRTALYHACDQPSPNERLVRLLLEKGGNFGQKSRPKMGNQPRYQRIRKMLECLDKK